jgi:predicted nucleotidyltransferase component of viral defense system
LSGGRGKNVAASVRQRLLNLSRKTGEDFQLVLTRYAIERLLYRLGASEFEKRFVLKGAMLFALWTGALHRPTRDLDLLGFGDKSDDSLAAIFRALCRVAGDDGLEFREETVEVGPIREDQEYGGKRVTLDVRLGSARVTLQIDVGFGDAITPKAEAVTYPTLLGMEAPTLRAYPRETVVAEKLEAMVKLGIANSRMKDFFDVFVMARTFPFEGTLLKDAFAATFGRRGTALPAEPPIALTPAFAGDVTKRRQWTAFLNRGNLGETVPSFDEVVKALGEFLMPPLLAAAQGRDFVRTWTAGGPWSAE